MRPWRSRPRCWRSRPHPPAPWVPRRLGTDFVEQRRRALDVREHERHRSRRLHSHRRIIRREQLRHKPTPTCVGVAACQRRLRDPHRAPERRRCCWCLLSARARPEIVADTAHRPAAHGKCDLCQLAIPRRGGRRIGFLSTETPAQSRTRAVECSTADEPEFVA